MRFQFDISNRAFFFSALVVSFGIVLTLAIAITASNPGHTSNDVMISINGAEKTLQSAIDDGSFKNITLKCEDVLGYVVGIYYESGDEICRAKNKVCVSVTSSSDALEPVTYCSEGVRYVSSHGSTAYFARCCKLIK